MITKYDVATIAAIHNLDDDEYHKLSAAQQRKIFGFVICGRKDIRFNSRDQGTVIIGKSVLTDYVSRDYTYEEFAQCMNEHKTVEA